jgi:hypothetical protein
MSRKIRWAGHVSNMEDMRNARTILSENMKGGDRFGELSVDRNKVLKRVLKKGCGLKLSGSG